MANQSTVSVPPNVDNPLVLRRFLLRVVEQLDIVQGKRAGTRGRYVAQEELIEAAEELQIRLTTALAVLEQLIAQAARLQVEVDETLEGRVDDLENNDTVQDGRLDGIDLDLISLDAAVGDLQDVSAYKGVLAEFDYDGVNVNITIGYNTASAARTAVGQYDITLSQSTYEGIGVLANSFVIITSTGHYSFSYTKVSATVLRVNVQDFASTAVDLLITDKVSVNATFSSPTSGLPDA